MKLASSVIKIIVVQSLFALLKAIIHSKFFDDSSIYKIVWPGYSEKVDDLLTRHSSGLLGDEEVTIITSVDNERFICCQPSMHSGSQHNVLDYSGSSPLEMIKTTLHVPRTCTYRIETYWTYEFCHGQYLLQYHEEKDSQRTFRQEYYLGQFISDANLEQDHINYLTNPPTRKFDEQIVPYLAVNYTQGTICEVNGKLRQTTVFYICDSDGKNHIASVDEVASCYYELVIKTPKLCDHPGFHSSKIREGKIECFPANKEGSAIPTAMTLWEQERKWRAKVDLLSGADILPSIPNSGFKILAKLLNEALKSNKKKLSDIGQEVLEEASDDEQSDSSSSPPSAQSPQLVNRRSASPPHDKELLSSFLNGDRCLEGGSEDAWWKYKFCYGKSVVQYHVDPNDSTLDKIIVLGKWNVDVHKKWLQDMKNKGRPSKRLIQINGSVTQISHFYADGDTCEETGQKRSIEVKLVCKESALGGSSNAVALYLLEPRTCEYIMGIESPMFCEILNFVDDQMLLPEAAAVRQKDQNELQKDHTEL